MRDLESTPIIKYDGPPELRKGLEMEGRKFLGYVKGALGGGNPHQKFVKKFNDGTVIEAQSISNVGEVDILNIVVPRFEAEYPKEKKRIRRVIDCRRDEIVAIVELCNGSDSSTVGFAAFSLGDGVGPQEDSDKIGWGGLAGFTANVGEADKKDVSVFDGRLTYRTGKCVISATEGEKKIEIRELARIDQGYLSYDTGTQIDTIDNVWSYEPPYNVDDLLVHDHCYVYPGPPPESLCGYTWGIDETHGEADYYDLVRRLFYGVGSGFVPPPFIAYWPREFNQEYRKMWECFIDGWLMPSTSDTYGFEMWDRAETPHWYDIIGIRSTDAAPYIFKNSFSQLIRRKYYNYRHWGLMTDWGNATFSLDDSGGMEFPYTSPVFVDLMDYTLTSQSFWYWGDAGVYVETSALNFAYMNTFIQGGLLILGGTGARVLHSSYWTINKRVAVNIDTEFSETAKGNLTDRELVLLAGNEDLTINGLTYSPPSPFTGASSMGENHLWRTGDIKVAILAAGDVFYIEDGVKYTDIGSDGHHNTKKDEYWNLSFPDYGIFNVNGKREITSQSDIAPACAYACTVTDHDTDEVTVRYGVVYSGKLFRSSIYQSRDTGTCFEIPDLDGIKDQNGNQLYALGKIRVGLKVTTWTEEEEYA